MIATVMITALWVTPLFFAVIAFPRWPYSRTWGYVPAAALTFVALLVLTLHLLYVI